MTRTRALALVGGFGAVVIVAAAIVFAQTIRAPAEGPEPLAAQVGEGAAAAEPSGGTQEGVQVHGHWVIEVRDPDGTLVSRTEFDNALVANGKTVLAKVLSRERLVGEWTISLTNSTTLSLNPCETLSATPAACKIKESGSASTTVFPTLTVTRSGEQVVLSGTAIASKSGAISSVSSSLEDCDPTTPTSCASALVFTNQTIGSVSVGLGQGILVTVTLSFS